MGLCVVEVFRYNCAASNIRFMRKFKYPVDTDQFQLIRERGYFYVDKTGMLFDLVNTYNYVFLARPRRFGKSLMCTTLKAYFEGRKELFLGLKMAEKETEWKKHPVLHFNMSGLKNCSVAVAQSKLEGFIRDYEEIYGRKDNDNSPGARFRTLIHNAVAQTGEKAVIILDEYDSPIMRLLYNKTQLEEMRALLREFYQVLKDEGAYLRFVFITGVTKFSQLSIFSEFNNLIPISMLDEYSDICGISQQELSTIMRPCIDEYAEALGLSADEAYALLKRNYDGYHFSPNGQDIYAPFSLLRALDEQNTNNYWFESSTSAALIEHLRHFPKFNPLDYDGVEVSVEVFNSPCEHALTPIPLLYQSGYLTIDSYNKLTDSYTLHFPNFEVRQGLLLSLSNYLLDADELESDSCIIRMANALHSGDLMTALLAVRAWIGALPYDIISRKEWMAKKDREDFYKLLMYVVFTLLNRKVDTEVKSVRGRADVVIQTENYVYVLELKVDKSVDEALRQIDTAGYAIPYESGGRQTVRCGVSISSEARNIVHWKAVADDGSVISEQTF